MASMPPSGMGMDNLHGGAPANWQNAQGMGFPTMNPNWQMPPMGSPMGSMNMGGWGGASAYGDPRGFGPNMGQGAQNEMRPRGNPINGFGGIGGNNQGAQQQYQAYGWNPQSLPMNWGGPYGPLSWPSYNQMSMNAGGLYGSMFNPWLMLQGGAPNQPPSQGGGSTAPNPNPAPPPIPAPGAPTTGGLMSPHFAFHATQGTPMDVSNHLIGRKIYTGGITSNPFGGPTV